MGRPEESEYHMQTLDPEFHAYIKQKKQISDRIHDHWKLELNKHVKKTFLFINNFGWGGGKNKRPI